MINETFKITIDSQQVEVEHKGLKPFSQQENGINDLKECIQGEINDGHEDGFIPYNNFECSVNWKLLEVNA